MGNKMEENIKTLTNEYKYHLEKVCSDYNMSADINIKKIKNPQIKKFINDFN